MQYSPEQAQRALQATMTKLGVGPGTIIGGIGGYLTSPEESGGEGLARGLGQGVGWDLGSYAGIQGGAMGGQAALLAAMRHSSSPSSFRRAALASLLLPFLGYGVGGAAGAGLGRAAIGPPSWELQNTYSS